MVYENGVKNIQAAAYNGARTVLHTYLPIIYIIKAEKKINVKSVDSKKKSYR